MFKDKVYEEMDDISKLIEPYQYSVNEDLSRFPDEVVITPDELMSPWGLSTKDVFRNRAKELGLNSLVDASYKMQNDFFEFKIINEFGEFVDSANLNFNEGTISEKIIMVKNKIAYEDSDVEKIAKQTILDGLSTYRSYRLLNVSRLNEIADLFNDNATKKERSVRKKMHMFRRHIDNLVSSKKLDIRDVELCSRFANWIILYIEQGNLAALNNITRLKIMTHQNKPIYSIQEKETR